MFCTPEFVQRPSGFAYAATEPLDAGPERMISGFVPAGSIPLSEIRIGETVYRLRIPVKGMFVPTRDGWDFWVEGFGPVFIGTGPDPEQAFLDWRDQVHEAFQEQYGKRPFERCAEDCRQWEVLERMIDVVGYRNETPVLVRQIGRITQARPRPRQITWVDDSQENNVRLDLFPHEFAAFKPGQWFEAIVERDSLSWKLRRVRSVQRIPTVDTMSEPELARFWSSLPLTTALPESNTDWTEP